MSDIRWTAETNDVSDYVGAQNMNNVDSITRELIATDSTVSVDGSPLPTDGYWVGVAGKGVVIDENTKSSAWLAVYAMVEREIGTATYFGSWQDEKGTLYVDVVEHWRSLTLALMTGRARGEIAIWDIANAQEISCDLTPVPTTYPEDVDVTDYLSDSELIADYVGMPRII